MHEKSQFELLVKAFKETPKILQIITIVFYCPYRWKVSPYCWKHNVPRGSWVSANMNVSSLRIGFCDSKNFHESLQKMEKTSVLPIYDADKPYKKSAWQYNHAGIVMAHISWQ